MPRMRCAPAQKKAMGWDIPVVELTGTRQQPTRRRAGRRQLLLRPRPAAVQCPVGGLIESKEGSRQRALLERSSCRTFPPAWLKHLQYSSPQRQLRLAERRRGPFELQIQPRAAATCRDLLASPRTRWLIHRSPLYHLEGSHYPEACCLRWSALAMLEIGGESQMQG